jgi:hypothetical protein
MIVWRGYGILVLIFTIAGYAIGRVGAEQIWGSPLPNTYRSGAELVGMLLAAATVYVLHRALEARQAPRVMVDKATGQEIEIRPKNDLFFIPVKFWPYILALLGVLFFFQK